MEAAHSVAPVWQKINYHDTPPMCAKIRKVTKIWTCKDGRRVRICDMDNQHLVNTVRMLERKMEDAQSAMNPFMYPPPQGEMALMAWENECARYHEGSFDDDGGDLTYLLSSRHPLYEPLLDELERRGLRL
jgi:hypothetical protein